MAILDARKVGAEQAGAPLHISLRETFLFAQKSQSLAKHHRLFENKFELLRCEMEAVECALCYIHG